MNRSNILAAAVGVAGWVTTLSFHEFAAGLAGLATAFWFAAQSYVLLRRDRCKKQNCKHREQ